MGKPDPSLHDLYLGVEPYTGITTVEQNRAMISARIHAEPNIPGLDHGWFPKLGDRTLFVPVAWFNERSLVTADGADQFSDLYFALTAQEVLRWIGICFGGMAFILSLAVVGA